MSNPSFVDGLLSARARGNRRASENSPKAVSKHCLFVQGKERLRQLDVTGTFISLS